MQIQSLRAVEIDNYLRSRTDAEIGRWPIEISGLKQILPYYRIPVRLLRYNVANGRLAMEVREWSIKNERDLDPNDKGDVGVLEKMCIDQRHVAIGPKGIL
jgi:hypothetical protein